MKVCGLGYRPRTVVGLHTASAQRRHMGQVKGCPPGVGTRVPSAGRREVLRVFLEGPDSGQICSLERYLWQNYTGRLELG